MKNKAPHLVQYQGSKRLLASQIINYMPAHFNKLFEPFSGVASISIAAALEGRANSFHINDINSPLVAMLRECVENPENLINGYSRIWNGQFSYRDGHIQHFYNVRELFNNGAQSPATMLYLLARCVKGSVRYGKNGNFNQSPDKRRHGTNPKTMAQNIRAISALLKGKAIYSSLDYNDIFAKARPGDIVYMDPPYQGVCDKRDNRYLAGISYDDFSSSLEILDKNNIDYLISYDGECGGKTYGQDLPKDLQCEKILLTAGLSTQETLLGRKSITREALYVSHSLFRKYKQKSRSIPKQLFLNK